VVKGDGDQVWSRVLTDCASGELKPLYEGGRVEADHFEKARWDLLPPASYMWASVQTVRGCPKHCSFCSVWRTDGQKPRQRTSVATYVLGGVAFAVAGGLTALMFFSPRTRTRALSAAKDTYGKVNDKISHLKELKDVKLNGFAQEEKTPMANGLGGKNDDYAPTGL